VVFRISSLDVPNFVQVTELYPIYFLVNFMKKTLLILMLAATSSMNVALADNLPNLSEASMPTKLIQASLRNKKDAICTACHDETEKKPILSVYQTKHGVRGDAKTPTCQACHGESTPHVTGKSLDGSKNRPAPEIVYTKGSYPASGHQAKTDACQTCHKRDDKRTHWNSSKHENADVSCSTCHTVHAAKDRVMVKTEQAAVCYTCHMEQRAQGRHQSVHPIDAGKITCSDCHNPHGSPTDRALIKETINATCFTCHAEKRGPFLWEHQPVTEDCSSCHVAHGSNIAPLLKSRSPYLCQECHNGPHQSDKPIGMGAAGVQGGQIGAGTAAYAASGSTGRACQNCHSMIHGSNHTAGAFLHR
jgi:DmsE family decaheme c-type cytochrome